MNEEIRSFQSLGRGNSIYCLLVRGSTDPNSPEYAFPAALLRNDEGGMPHEPLAADISPQADGRRGALLKLIAGIIGVGVDDLRQRDVQRRFRVRSAVATASSVISFITIGLAIIAQNARKDAELRTGQAERLISFMLGDLRDKLETVGRLDLLEAVGDEALEYFAALGDVTDASDEMLTRAQALRQIGEVRLNQGRSGSALEAFEQSRIVAQALHDSAPENNTYLFELSQAEFWVGYVAYEFNARIDQAQSSMLKYMNYSLQLVDREPDNLEYQMELSYAYSNLGTVALEQREPQEALMYFQRSIEVIEDLIGTAPDQSRFRYEHATVTSWLGQSYRHLHRLAESEDAYRLTVDRLEELYSAEGELLYAEQLVINLRHLANTQLLRGARIEAQARFANARTLADEIVAHDPDNAAWRAQRAIVAYLQSDLSSLSMSGPEAREDLDQAIQDLSFITSLGTPERQVLQWFALAKSLAAIFAVDTGTLDQAAVLSAEAEQILFGALDAAKAEPGLLADYGIVADRLASVQIALGDRSAATLTWTNALGLLETEKNPSLTHIAVERRILKSLGKTEEAAQREAQLLRAGFLDPRFQ